MVAIPKTPQTIGGYASEAVKTDADDGDPTVVGVLYSLQGAADFGLVLPSTVGLKKGEAVHFLSATEEFRVLITSDDPGEFIIGEGNGGDPYHVIGGFTAKYTFVYTGTSIGAPAWNVIREPDTTAGVSKPAVDLATTAPLPAYTASGSGADEILTADANGELIIDGVEAIATAPLLAGVLIKNEVANSKYNGIWQVLQPGVTGVSPWILRRRIDWLFAKSTVLGTAVTVMPNGGLGASGVNNNGRTFLTRPGDEVEGHEVADFIQQPFADYSGTATLTEANDGETPLPGVAYFAQPSADFGMVMPAIADTQLGDKFHFTLLSGDRLVLTAEGTASELFLQPSTGGTLEYAVLYAADGAALHWTVEFRGTDLGVPVWKVSVGGGPSLQVHRLASVDVATTEALPAYVASGVDYDAILTASVNGFLTVDGIAIGVSPGAAERGVLVKNEAPGKNGLYQVLDGGSAGSKWVLRRRADFVDPDCIANGVTIVVDRGTVNAGRRYHTPAGQDLDNIPSTNFLEPPRDLKWHTAVIDNTSFTADVGVLYPWSDTGGAPTMTFPPASQLYDGAMVGVKKTVKSSTYVCNLTTNGADVEDPGADASTPAVSGFYPHPLTGGFGGELAVAIWKYSVLTGKWHILHAAAANNAAVDSPP